MFGQSPPKGDAAGRTLLLSTPWALCPNFSPLNSSIQTDTRARVSLDFLSYERKPAIDREKGAFAQARCNLILKWEGLVGLGTDTCKRHLYRLSLSVGSGLWFYFVVPFFSVFLSISLHGLVPLHF